MMNNNNTSDMDYSDAGYDDTIYPGMSYNNVVNNNGNVSYYNPGVYQNQYDSSGYNQSGYYSSGLGGGGGYYQVGSVGISQTNGQSDGIYQNSQNSLGYAVSGGLGTDVTIPVLQATVDIATVMPDTATSPATVVKPTSPAFNQMDSNLGAVGGYYGNYMPAGDASGYSNSGNYSNGQDVNYQSQNYSFGGNAITFGYAGSDQNAASYNNNYNGYYINTTGFGTGYYTGNEGGSTGYGGNGYNQNTGYGY